MPNYYMFTDTPNHDTPEDLVNLLGGKGANINRMINELSMPVPEGFTIPCKETFQLAGTSEEPKLRQPLIASLNGAIVKLNETTGRKLGDTKNPLLVSVRSGAPKSMPGMMETILNLGLNDDTVVGLAAQTNERFAWDSYRRFIQMYAVTALDLDPRPFNEVLEAAKAFYGSTALTPDVLQVICRKFKRIAEQNNTFVPQDVKKQLQGAVLAVFRSWSADKAKSYRKIENIPDDLGTAVNVQRMVFGNLNDNSGTGVAFTRNPNTGEHATFGDFLVNAQGEDVVDGSSVTMPLVGMAKVFPNQYVELGAIMEKLEATYKDMCDIEFTIEDGKLYMLQTRVGKRNPQAAVAMAIDMVQEGLIDADTAKERIFAVQSAPLVENEVFNGVCIGEGLAASPGKVSGIAVFTSEEAVKQSEKGKEVILIRHETSPSDVEGMACAKGILTAKGGLVSHAAVVARGWGKPCVVGFDKLSVDTESASIDGTTIKQGDTVCIDGDTGEVFIVA